MCICFYTKEWKPKEKNRKKVLCVAFSLWTNKNGIWMHMFCCHSVEKNQIVCVHWRIRIREKIQMDILCAWRVDGATAEFGEKKINTFVWFKQKPKWKMFDIKVEIILIEIKGQKSKWKKNLHKIDSVPKFGVLKYSLYRCPPRKLSLLEGVSVGFFSHGNSLGANHSCKQTKGFGKQMKIFVLNNPKIPF